MASHRRTPTPHRTRVTVLTAVAATTVAITANAQSAQAAPPPSTASLAAEVQADNVAADAAVQRYDTAQEQQQQLQQQVTVLQNEIARQQAAINAQESLLGAAAAAQYRDGGTIDPTVQLMLSADPSNYLDQASTTVQLNSSQAELLSGLQGAETTLDREKATAEAKLRALAASAARLAAAKTQVQQKLSAAQARLNSFTAAQRLAVDQELNGAPATTTAHNGSGGHGAGDGNGGGDSSGGGAPVDLGHASAGDAVEAAAFAAAQTRLGDPYVWSHTGPTTFDCSGLMMWAYDKAGLNIGRTTYDQVTQGTPVASESDLQVGDLVFFNDDTHVGMYAGNGMILHAPHKGTVVRYESIDTVGTVYAMRHL
ncbi:C40 family peptidase [Streptacidiphilus sp. PB12-B1b]|uniref:C40 family peptidase n=1 Tax=Streptacidiphilus sp. PB12-B1b TaxID=2705012 RepID=UPI0015FE7E54|nr:C40 family peptidase [Streptacidiphilus sp. PB12-B1b]QMU76758.1 C40 family peptidase [Streptacidiphilus sp. PB12-B1b]